MCAVIGAYLRNPSAKDFEIVRQVFLQSSIRGLHATGCSYIYGGSLKTVRDPHPARVFLEKIAVEDFLNEDGNLYLIGHCRYSTSDLRFNQPVSNAEFAVVHNGVISQEPPHKWLDLYGHQCSTMNDTELLFHSVIQNKSSLEGWRDSSISAIELYHSKRMRFYRNGKRPLWYSLLDNGIIVTSTKDIAFRAGLQPREVQAYVYFSVDPSFDISMSAESYRSEDLQDA